MARSSILNLKRISAQPDFSAYNAEPFVESAEQAAREDCLRARHAILTRDRHPEAFNSPAFRNLRRGLIGERLHEYDFRTSASARDMRGWRLAAVEQLWRLTIESDVSRCHAWTAIIQSWVLTPEQLAQTTAKQLTEQFRSLLNRRGAGRAEGWLLAKLDIEFDPRNRLYRGHLHGMACGEMVEALESARTSRVLQPHLTPMIEGRRVKRPLQIDRRPLTNLPTPLTYILKGHFTARWLGFTPEGKAKRGNRAIRIPEPYGTQTLLWLDRQPIQHMLVTMNLVVRDGQLVRRT